MKKLVMMATALVAASSFAQCTPGDTPDPVNCAQVYNVALSLKTTAGKSGAVDIGTECAPGSTSVCYRVISKMTLKGYLSNCTCGCDTFVDNVLDLFDTKTDEMVVSSGSITWDILGRIGKKNAEVEAQGTINGTDMEMMGFGKYDAKNDRISSISGQVQGTLIPPSCTVACAPGGTAYPNDLCDPSIPQMVNTIAYGTFSIKYNSSASKKYADWDGYVASLLPDVI
jgi:hypothetical protein